MSLDSQQEQQRKSVSFGRNVTVHVLVVPNQKKLGRKEKSKLWLSSEEFLMIRDNCLDEIDILDDAEEFDIFRFRGLEMVARDAKGMRQVQDSIHGVLNEQQVQRQTGDGTMRPKSIRKVYKELTVESSHAALENAYIDQMAVKDYLQNTESELRQEMEERHKKQQQQLQLQMQKQKQKQRSNFGRTQLMKSVKSVRRSLLSRRTAPLVTITA